MNSPILLTISNISKRYKHSPDNVFALSNVTFDLYQGEIVSLLGANGAGKTTLSSIIATLHPPTSGTLLWNNVSIYDHLYAYRHIIGFCPQKPLFANNLSIEENLIFAGKFFLMSHEQARARAQELLTLFDLNRYAEQLPSILSGGYKQRLLIARALMHSPQLVILDEPTVALDPHIRRHLWEIIKTLKASGVTILLTTHYLEEAEELSDRVVILDKGIVKLIDTPSHLRASYNKESLEDVFIHLMEENV